MVASPWGNWPLAPPRPFKLRDLVLASRDQNQALIRSHCMTAYLGRSTALSRVLGRYKMFVDTTDVGFSSHLMLDGYWEMWLTEALVGAVKPGMTVIDAGANLGYFTLLMANLVGPEGSVHAFEPNPPIAELLAKSVDVNGFRERVVVHPDPLGAEDGEDVTLIVRPGEPKNAHIIHDPGFEGGVKLKTRRLDSDPRLLAADVIKIDVEGAELDIWRGMTGLLEMSPKPLTIFLEFASVRYPNSGAFLDDIIARGFQVDLLTLKNGIQPRSREQILAAPGHIDQLLVLRRPAR